MRSRKLEREKESLSDLTKEIGAIKFIATSAIGKESRLIIKCATNASPPCESLLDKNIQKDEAISMLRLSNANEAQSRDDQCPRTPQTHEGKQLS